MQKSASVKHYLAVYFRILTTFGLTSAIFCPYLAAMEPLFIEQSRNRVRNALRTVSKVELARLAGIPESTIWDVAKPSWRCNARTLQRLEEVARQLEAEQIASAAELAAGP